MSTMPRSRRERARMVAEERQVLRFFRSRSFQYGNVNVPTHTGSRFTIRTDMPETDGSGAVSRTNLGRPISRTERLMNEVSRREATKPAHVDEDGVSGTVGVIYVCALVLVLLVIWLASVSGVINLNHAIDTTRNSISSVKNRIIEMEADIEKAKSEIDVAYQATGLGMVPARSTAVVSLTIGQNAIIGPNGLSPEGTISVLR